MILNIWDITDMKICKRNFKTKIHNIFRTRGVSIVPPICVGTKIPSITEERLSRNRRIGPGALEKIFKFRQCIFAISYSQKDTLCQVSLKLAQWFWKRRFISFWKRAWLFIWINLYQVWLKLAQWFWRGRWKYKFTDRRTAVDQKSSVEL